MWSCLWKRCFGSSRLVVSLRKFQNLPTINNNNIVNKTKLPTKSWFASYTAVVLFIGWAWRYKSTATEKEFNYEEFIKIGQLNFEKFKELISLPKETNWAFDFRKDNCIGYIRRHSGSDVHCIKTLGKIALEPNELCEKIWNAGRPQWIEYYKPFGKLLHWKIIHNINDSNRIIYMLLKMQLAMGKKPREYILLQSRFEGNNGEKFIVYKSIDYEALGTDSIRGHVDIGGYEFAPTDSKNETLLTHVLHQDPRGQTSPLLVNTCYEFAYLCPRRFEAMLGLNSPPGENWWKLLWQGKKEWEKL